MRIIDEGALWVRFAVGKDDLERLAPGRKVAGAFGPGGTKIAGQVIHVSPEVDPVSDLVLAEASLTLPDPAPRALAAGLVVKVGLE